MKARIKQFKERLKNLNPNFEDGILYPDECFKQLLDVIDNPDDIIFGVRHLAVNLIIGLQKELLFINSKSFKSSANIQKILFDEISNIKIEQGYGANRLILIVSGNGLEIEKLDKKQSEYLYENIQEKIGVTEGLTTKKSSLGSTLSPTINFNCKDVKIKIVASDLPSGFKLVASKNELVFEKSKGLFGSEKIPVSGNINAIEQITEENKNSLLKKAGWGTVGGILFGPLGVAAGLWFTGKSKEVCFACELKSGYKFVAVADKENYQKILALSYI